MVKVYYSYEFAQTISQPINRQCNFAVVPKRSSLLYLGKIIVAGVNQYIAIIALKTGEVLKYLYENERNVNVRVVKTSENRIYVGYEDGRISIYDLDDEQFVCSLDLHKSTVSSIDVDENDTKMVSAGLDGNIFVWDLLSEESQKMYFFRLNL